VLSAQLLGQECGRPARRGRGMWCVYECVDKAREVNDDEGVAAIWRSTDE
jgi:hypothetical protein